MLSDTSGRSQPLLVTCIDGDISQNQAPVKHDRFPENDSPGIRNRITLPALLFLQYVIPLRAAHFRMKYFGHFVEDSGSMINPFQGRAWPGFMREEAVPGIKIIPSLEPSNMWH